MDIQWSRLDEMYNCLTVVSYQWIDDAKTVARHQSSTTVRILRGTSSSYSLTSRAISCRTAAVLRSPCGTTNGSQPATSSEPFTSTPVLIPTCHVQCLWWAKLIFSCGAIFMRFHAPLQIKLERVCCVGIATKKSKAVTYANSHISEMVWDREIVMIRINVWYIE